MWVLGYTSNFFVILRVVVQRCSVKKKFLEIWQNSQGNQSKSLFQSLSLCQSLFFNKVAACKACKFIKKETLAQVFSCDFVKFLRTPFYAEYLWVAASVIHRKIDNWDLLMLLSLDFSRFFQYVKEMEYWDFWMLV